MKFFARSALSLGLAAVLSPAGFASGLVLADNDVRNDLAWLSDRGTLSLSLSTWPLSEEEIGRALANAHPTTPAERVVLGRVNQRLRALKADMRWSARLIYAEVTPKNQRINKAFPHADTLKGVQLGWSGDVMPTVRLSTSVWYTDANHSDSDDLGASMGIELPFSL